MLLPLFARVEAEIASVVDVRGDAGFVSPRLLDALEARDVRSAFRLPTNRLIAQIAEPHLYRPPGRPPTEWRTWTGELRYQAGTWEEKRRVALVVCERSGELYLVAPDPLR